MSTYGWVVSQLDRWHTIYEWSIQPSLPFQLKFWFRCDHIIVTDGSKVSSQIEPFWIFYHNFALILWYIFYFHRIFSPRPQFASDHWGSASCVSSTATCVLSVVGLHAPEVPTLSISHALSLRLTGEIACKMEKRAITSRFIGPRGVFGVYIFSSYPAHRFNCSRASIFFFHFGVRCSQTLADAFQVSPKPKWKPILNELISERRPFVRHNCFRERWRQQCARNMLFFWVIHAYILQCSSSCVINGLFFTHYCSCSEHLWS